MKRLLICLLAVSLTASFVSCDGFSFSRNDTDTTTETEIETDTVGEIIGDTQ